MIYWCSYVDCVILIKKGGLMMTWGIWILVIISGFNLVIQMQMQSWKKEEHEFWRRDKVGKI